MFDMQQVGQRIAELRKSKDMTQMAFADAMGVSFQAVSNWERGKSMPDIAKLPELANLLDTTIDRILGGEADVLQHVVSGNLADAMKEGTVLTKDIADIAPLLKPSDVHKILSDSEEMEGESIAPYLPFASADFVGELAMRHMENANTLSLCLPYLSQADAAKIAFAKAAKDGVGSMVLMLPYLSANDVKELADRYPDSIASFLPFLSEGDVAEIAFAKTREKDADALKPLLPFLSAAHVKELAHRHPDKIQNFAPFMSADDIADILKALLNKKM